MGREDRQRAPSRGLESRCTHTSVVVAQVWWKAASVARRNWPPDSLYGWVRLKAARVIWTHAYKATVAFVALSIRAMTLPKFWGAATELAGLQKLVGPDGIGAALTFLGVHNSSVQLVPC